MIQGVVAKLLEIAVVETRLTTCQRLAKSLGRDSRELWCGQLDPEEKLPYDDALQMISKVSALCDSFNSISLSGVSSQASRSSVPPSSPERKAETLPVPAPPLPAKAASVVGCVYVFIRGKNKGKNCNLPCVAGSPFCSDCVKKPTAHAQLQKKKSGVGDSGVLVGNHDHGAPSSRSSDGLGDLAERVKEELNKVPI